MSLTAAMSLLLRRACLGLASMKRPVQAALMLLLLLPGSYALALPTGFTEEVVVTGLNDPTNIITMPDGYMMTVEKEGRVRRFNPTNNIPMLATSILKINVNHVEFDRERGAASIALDPDYENNGYFYLYYTQAINDSRNRVARFTMGNNNQADPASEVLVWEDNEPFQDCCHYGGGLDFGPDGMLYVTTGEEFDGPQAQDLSRAGGKIIRLDPSTIDAQGPWVRGASNDHIIPDDNPFIDGAGPNLDEIWALGLRNPFRAHWDIPSNRFFVSEVGGNIQATASEDLHLGRAGANYGWPYCEGSFCTNLPASITLDPPLYAYNHEGVTPNGGAIAAGFVYRHDPSFGNPFPNSYDGVFFFADYANGDIKYLTFNPDGSVASVNDFASGVGSPVALELGPDGSLYAVDYIAERVVRYRYFSGNQPPVITSTSADPIVGTPPLEVTFTATATDAEGDPLTYRWFFGDGSQQDGQTVTHTYTADGSYNAFVRVLDPLNSTSSAFVPINVGTPPVARIDTPVDGSTFIGGETIAFSGSVVNPQPGENYTYEWDIDFTHNAHTHPTASLISQSGEFDINVSGHDYHDDTGYRLVLKVTDESGLFSTDTVQINPQKIDLDLLTIPAGLSVFVDALPVTTPSSYDTIVNFNHNVSVPQTLCEGGIVYEFDTWSDGGARSHGITTPASNMQLTASFNQVGTCAQIPANGLVAHFESDQGVTSNGLDLTGWTDQSASGNDLTIVDGNPSVIDNALNGFPVVSFDGVGDVMRRTAPLNNFPTGAQDRTMFMVANYRGTGYGGAAMGNPSPNEVFGLIVAPNGNLGVQAWGPNDFVGTTGGTGAGWLRQSAVVSGNQMTHYRNGAQIGSANIQYNTNPTDFVLGAEIDLSPNVNMQVAAVLVYNRALSAAERDQVESYLQSKFFNSGGNQAPIARDDSGSTSTGGTVDVAVLANDSDSDDGLDLSSVTVTQPSHGTVQVLASGEVRYTHDGGASTTDSFTYIVDDLSGQASNLATVTLSIGGGGGGPGSIGNVPATGLVAYFEADRGVNVGAENVVFSWEDQSGQGNDLTADGDPRLLDTGGPNGEATITFNGTSDLLARTTPTGVATGAQNRSMYLVTRYDGNGFGGAAYGSAVTNQAFGLVVDSAGDLAVQGWGLANDQISGEFGNGAGWLIQSVVLDGNQGVHYLNDTAIDTFTHTYATTADRLIVGAELNEARFVDMDVSALFVYDRALNATEHAQVLAYLEQKYGAGGGTVNESPVAQNDTGSVVSDSQVQLTVLANDSDPDGELNVNSVQVIAAPANGTATVNTDGTITYAHTVGNTATTDSFTYQVSDDQGALSNVATVNMTINDGGVGNPGGIGDVPAAGLAAYYEADRGVSTGTGGAVTAWEDQSGNGNTLTSVGDPMVVTGPNSEPAIDFDGAGDLLARTGLNGVPTGASDRSMYVVASYDSVGWGGVAYGSPTTNNAFGLIVSDDGEQVVQGWGLANDFRSGTTGTGAGWQVMSVVVDGNQGTHYLGANQLNTFTHSYATTANRMVVGAELSEPPYLDMQVSAVIIYDRALSTVEHNQVVSYLEGKYGAGGGGPTNDSPIATDDTGSVGNESTVQLSVLGNDSDPDGQLDVSSVQIVGAPANGTAIVNTDGTIEYSHTVGNTAASDSFTYRVSDDQGALSNVATVTITISGPANDSPVAVDDSGSVVSESSIQVTVLANDSDPDGQLDVSSVQIVAAPANGTATVNTDGTITYTHTVGNTATTDSFTYQVSDDQGAVSNVATVSMTITGGGVGNPGGIGDVPAGGLAAYYEADRGVTTGAGGAVTAWEDQSGNGNTLTSAGNPMVVTGPNAEPAIGFDGTDDLLARTGLNGVPTGAADRSMYVVANYDSVGWGGVAYGSPTTNKAFGLIVSASGEQVVQGWGFANDFNSGTAGTGAGWQVMSVVVDGNQGTHYLGVDQLNTFTHSYATTANRMVVGAELGEPPYLNMQVSAVIIYDRALSTAEHNQVVSYLEGKYGAGFGGSNNDSPTAADDTGSVGNESTVQLSVLGNDSDTDGQLDVSSVTIVAAPANGTATVNTDGTIEYAHAVGNTASSDSFTYRVSDDQGALSNVATVTITISGPANNAPVAMDDTGTVVSESTVQLSVLSNDGDTDGQLDVSSVQIMAAPANGTATVNTDGTITYTHTVGNTATSDSFTYQVSDDQGAPSNVATVDVTITGGGGGNPGGGIGNVPATGLAAYYEADRGVSTGAGGAVTAWEDQSGNGNTLTSAGNPTVVSGPNSEPAIDFDGTGDLLARTGLNGMPTGASDRSMYVVARYDSVGWGGVAYGTPTANKAFGLIASASGELVVQGWGFANDFNSGTPGTGAGWQVQSVVIDGNQGTHYLGGSQLDTFTHSYATTANRMVIGAELAEPPYLDMQVSAVIIYDRALSTAEHNQVVSYLESKYGSGGGGTTNDSPIASNDSGSVGNESTVQLAVLSNDNDPDGQLDVSSVQVISAPANGAATVNTDGTIEYAHTVGNTATSDSFTYRVSDDQGALSNVATVTITISGAANNAPVAGNDSGTVVSESSVQLSVLSNDNDLDGQLDVSSVQIVAAPVNGTATVNTDGTISYAHTVGNTATSDSFTYQVSDDQGTASNVATVSVSITGGGGGNPGGIGNVPAAGLAAYYEADRGVSTGAGGAVTAWEDQSGNGNTLSGVGNPTIATSPTGEAVIDFDGNGDALVRASLSGFPTGASDRTVFLVASYESVGSGGFNYGLSQRNRAFGLSVESAGMLRVNGYARDYVSSTVGTGAGWLLQSAVLSGNQLSHLVNGVEIDSATNVYNTANGSMVLGSDLDQVPYVQMQVGALLVYDRALSANEQMQVLNYLQGKYF